MTPLLVALCLLVAGAPDMPRIAHVIEGGWSTESGPKAPTIQRDSNTVAIPWLVNAENIEYTRDGWFRKMPGAAVVNSTATGASDHVNGVFDYWLSGTSGAPNQQRMIYSGTAVYSESAGTLTARISGLTAGQRPWFEVVEDDLVIAFSGADVPRVWDQSSAASLGGTPPNFGFHVNHKTRLFAAGVATNQSRLYYSAANDHEDWTGGTAGSIDVYPDDGDVITGIQSHNNELVIFKGPYRGRIVRLTGSTPSDFALVPQIRGIGGVNQQSIIVAGGDLVFWSNLAIHSLAATDRFGDYAPAFLSDPISGYFTEQLNHSRFPFVWGINDQARGRALWTVSRAGATTHDAILVYDYRFQPPRFALWPAYAVASLAVVVDTSNEPRPWAGTYTGRVLRMNQTARNVAAAAYTGKVTWPYLAYGDATSEKTIQAGRVSIAPKGETSLTLGWQRDGATQQTQSVDQSCTATLGSSSDQFILDTSVLGGGRYIGRPVPQMEGTFQELQIEFSQGTADVDMEPHGFELDLEGAGLARAPLVG